MLVAMLRTCDTNGENNERLVFPMLYLEKVSVTAFLHIA